MKKEEALALGVPEERIREFQDLYNRDLRRVAARVNESGGGGVRAAIASMLPMIQDVDNLRKLLMSVTHFYITENRPPKSARPSEDKEGVPEARE